MSQLKHLKKAPSDIIKRLVNSGYETYLVGGAVRDLLLGVEPKDYDIVTAASPEEIRAIFGKRNCRIIGRRFRLAHVIEAKEIYEVSTFRKAPETSKRHKKTKNPADLIVWSDNKFGSLEEDAMRRDFTVNSLYYDLCGERGIIDFSNGLDDLKKGLVRSIGEVGQRFDEDPVRMIRALKLCGQYGFSMADNMPKVLNDKKSGITLVSRSRLFEELLKIVNHNKAEPILTCLQKYDILIYFWPVLSEFWEAQEGLLARKLMKLRARELEASKLGQSKTFALACVALPFLMSALNNGNLNSFWTADSKSEAVARKALRILFQEYQLPNFFSQRINAICHLLPRLTINPLSPWIFRHQEYHHARKLLEFLIEINGWDKKLLDELPEPAKHTRRRSTRKRPTKARRSKKRIETSKPVQRKEDFFLNEDN